MSASTHHRTVFVFDAIADDFETLKTELREEDQIELLAFSGPSYGKMDEVIGKTRERTATPKCFLTSNGELVALYGTAPTPNQDVGKVWFLGTDRMATHGQSVAFAARSEISELLYGYQMIYNYVYLSNERSCEWMRFLGFEAVARYTRLGCFGDGFVLFCLFTNSQARSRFNEWTYANPKHMRVLSRFIHELDLTGS